jgi:hypothetical protein
MSRKSRKRGGAGPLGNLMGAMGKAIPTGVPTVMSPEEEKAKQFEKNLLDKAAAQNAEANKNKPPVSDTVTEAKVEEQNVQSDTVSNIMTKIPFPANYIVNPLMGVAVKSINNYRLIRNIVNSVTIKKNKFQNQYFKLIESYHAKDPIRIAIEKDFGYACMLIKRCYYPNIGTEYEFLRISKEIHNSCLERKHLEKQIKLYNSVNEDEDHPKRREEKDFYNVFKNVKANKQNKGKFQALYDTIPNALDEITYKLDGILHNEIEQLFMFDGKNCSYIIIYIMHDMLNRIEKYTFQMNLAKDKPDLAKEKLEHDKSYGYINKTLVELLINIKHTTIMDSCDTVYSLLDILSLSGTNKVIENAMALKPGDLEIMIKTNIEEMKKKMKHGGTRLYRRSKRSVPKKRIPTRRRVKLIK